MLELSSFFLPGEPRYTGEQASRRCPYSGGRRGWARCRPLLD